MYTSHAYVPCDKLNALDRAASFEDFACYKRNEAARLLRQNTAWTQRLAHDASHVAKYYQELADAALAIALA